LLEKRRLKRSALPLVGTEDQGSPATTFLQFENRVADLTA